MKARPLVSEVRPLNQTQDRRVSWNQDETQKQNQDQTSSVHDQAHPQNRINQDQPPQDVNQNQMAEETSSDQQTHRPPPLKKKIQTAVESKRNLGPTARAAAFHLNSSSGLRKAQSVQNLLTDSGETQNLQRLR